MRGATLELTRGEIAWLRGDFESAVRAGLAVVAEWERSTYWVTWALDLAASGALWLGQAGRLRDIVVRIEVLQVGSRLGRAVRAGARGALAAVEGRTSNAVAWYGESVRLLREGGFGWAFGLRRLDFARAVGPEVPEARAAAEEARVVFERVRATACLERLDAVLAGADRPGPPVSAPRAHMRPARVIRGRAR